VSLPWPLGADGLSQKACARESLGYRRAPHHKTWQLGCNPPTLSNTFQGGDMNPWFVAVASSIPVAAMLFVRIRRRRGKIRSRQSMSAMDQPFS
jgi:hypothetical protein